MHLTMNDEVHCLGCFTFQQDHLTTAKGALVDMGCDRSQFVFAKPREEWRLGQKFSSHCNIHKLRGITAIPPYDASDAQMLLSINTG